MNMISVKQALEIIGSQAKPLSAKILPLQECLGLVASTSVIAPIAVPLFDNSAMDGYAFRFEDYENKKSISIVSEIQAGADTVHELPPSSCSRIFTGAPIPIGADTVIPQEDISIQNQILVFNKEISPGAHIRKKGSQTQKGTQILKAGTKLNASYLAFLATFGISHLEVFPKPKIGILVTGKELKPIGSTLAQHQIYESNSIALSLALKEMDITPEFSLWVDDDPEQLFQLLKKHVSEVDILLITGGISVGKYDYVRAVLNQFRVEEFFYKVKQKPGKPLYFGLLNTTAIFGLPGNPAAVLTCFYRYVKYFLTQKMSLNTHKSTQYGILISDYEKKAGLTHFVKAVVQNHKVHILPHQLSYQMDAFAQANAFAVLPENQEVFIKGEKVEIIPF